MTDNLLNYKVIISQNGVLSSKNKAEYTKESFSVRTGYTTFFFHNPALKM